MITEKKLQNTMGNETLLEAKQIIINEIKKIFDWMNKSEVVDEYAYIILWRPVEWIVEYLEFKRRIQDCPKLSFRDLYGQWKNLSVDQKLNNAIIDAKVKKSADRLRWLRNATVHHYESIYKDPYIWDEFFNFVDYFEKIEGIIVSDIDVYPPDIEISQYACFQMMCGSDAELALFNETYTYIKSPDASPLVSIQKMEYLAQRYAQSLLAMRGCKIEIKDGEGIFVDDKRTRSFIDYYTSELVMTYPSEIYTINKLKLIREIRNKAIHTVDAGSSVLKEFTTIWFELMQEFFCDSEGVAHTISKELELLRSPQCLDILEGFISAYDMFIPEKLIVDIKEVLIPVINLENKLKEVKAEYQERMAEAIEEKQELLLDELNSRLDDVFKTILEKQGKQKVAEYKKIIKDYLGEYETYLGESVRNYIITALSIKDTLDEKQFGGADYAGACIELTRAIEKLLYDKVFDKYCNYLDNHESEKNELSSEIRAAVKEDRIMLGQYKKIWGVEEGYDKDGQVYYTFCRRKHMYKNKTGDELRDLLASEEQLIAGVKSNYRDKAAHRLEINKKEMAECLSAVLSGENALIKRLLEDMEKG